MDLMTLLVKIGADSSEYESAIAKAEGTASSFGKGAISAIGGGLKTAAKIGAAAIGVATTAVGALAKASISGYAEHQQLVGGVQKLYGNMGMSLKQYAKTTGQTTKAAKAEWQSLEKAQTLVMKNADKAFKTAGMSANTYMEMATSFSASLITSLNGDTVKAAKQTDVAMKAISDNWNTFGGDLGMIQYAFQGFAKQNYTMLDNLKLGYGGTKAEMERLIEDANEYAESIGQASDLSMDSFSDIVTAIDLIQQKQNIAGTTARESATTIEGSFNTLKAAWENLVTGLANPDADLGKLMDDVVDSAEVAFENLMPVLEQALTSIGDFVAKIAPIISDKLPGMVEKVAPSLLSAVTSLITGLVMALPSLVVGLIEAVPDVLQTIGTAISDNAGKLQESLQTAFNTAVEGLSFDGLGENFSFEGMLEVGTTAANDFINGFFDGLTDLSGKAAEVINSLVDGLVNAGPALIEAGSDVVQNFVDGLMDSAPDLLADAGSIVTNLVDGILANAGQFMDAAGDVIRDFAEGIGRNSGDLADAAGQIIADFVTAIVSNAPSLIAGAAEMVGSLIYGILQALPGLLAVAVQIPLKVVQHLLQNAGPFLQAGVEWISKLAQGLGQKISTVVSKAKEIGTKAVTAFKSINWGEAGTKAINAIKNALSSAGSALMSALKSAGTKAMNGFKNVSWAAAGKAAIQKLKGAITSAGSAIMSALRAVGTQGMNAFRSINWSGLGTAVINGIKAGISAGAGAIKSALVGIAQGALAAAKSALGIASPSKVFKEQVGKNIALGVAKGIEENKKYAEKKASEMGQAILEKAQKRLDNSKVYREWDLKAEAAYWNEIRKHIKKGTQARVDADAKYFETRRALREEEDQKILDKAVVHVGKVVKNAKTAAKEIAKAAKNVYGELINAADKWLQNYQITHSTTLKFEMDYWAKIREEAKKTYGANSQEYLDATKKFIESRDAFRAAKKKAQELVATFFSEYNKALAEFKQKKDEYEAERIKRLADNQKKEIEDLAKLEDDYQKKLSDINAKLASDIKAATDEYNKSVESRKKSIMGFTDLFERTKFGKTYSKEYVVGVLEEQVNALEEWDAQLDSLESRLGRDNPLYQELEDMGVESLYTLKEINSMSDEELKAYSDLYDKKAQVASDRAVQENAQLYEETQARIAQYQSNAEKERQALADQYAADRAEIIKQAAAERELINEEIDKNIEELRKKTSETLNALNTELVTGLDELVKTAGLKGKEIGQAIWEGIGQGIERMATVAPDLVDSTAEDMLNMAKETLGINSPSKKFRWIGEMVDSGLAQGIAENAQEVKDQIDRLLETPQVVTVKDAPTVSASGGYDGGFVQNLTVNAPQALSPSEVARQTRLANQQMVLALRGV